MSLSAEDAATLQAYFEGVDAARAEAEAKWGVGRLFLLVDDELRAKFYRQQASWSAALQEAWGSIYLSRDQLDAVARKAGAMKRGWAALDAAAEEAGHRPIFPDVWEARRADGSIVALVRTEAERGKVIASGRAVEVWTPEEVVNLLDAAKHAVVGEVKRAFPGARVMPPRGSLPELGDDEIPF